MDIAEFRQLFEAALQLAAERAEQKIGRTVPRTFLIKLYGGGYSGHILDLETATRVLYLGADTFYRIIDVAVIEITDGRTICFVRASQHRPGPLEQTWNEPPGYGPFKQIEARDVAITPKQP